VVDGPLCAGLGLCPGGYAALDLAALALTGAENRLASTAENGTPKTSKRNGKRVCDKNATDKT
jgi:hypothetical protein